MSGRSPKVFMSYSHDSQTHVDWVLTLATRLLNNGVDVILDQWDLALGGDLPRFMESGLTTADRVLAVCTEKYVQKSNSGIGGVGFEKMILTAQLMKNLTEARIVPIIRDNSSNSTVPVFLGSRLYIDFRVDSDYENKYAELLRDIHGRGVKPRPKIGVNPFDVVPSPTAPQLAFSSERYVSPAMIGRIVFDYSNNDGKYVLGAGDMAFETKWSRGGNTSIYALNDPPSIRTVAIAHGATHFSDIQDASVFDTSSRHRSPHVGEIVVWQNTAGYYLATKIEKLQSRGHGFPADEVQFSYEIAPNKSVSFASARSQRPLRDLD